MEWIKYSLVYTADSIRKFDSKSNRTADSIRDSIRTQKKRFAGPYLEPWFALSEYQYPFSQYTAAELPDCYNSK